MPRRARAIARDRRLKTFYENILRNAALNFNNKEIQDIQIAVRQMLERVTAQMNAESSFKISYIQPCGSMEEKASILKSFLFPYEYNGILLTKYIEFDYLAILDKPDIKLEGSCSGCSFEPQIFSKFGLPLDIDCEDVFKMQLRNSFTSLCSCFSLRYHHYKDENPFLLKRYSFKPANPDTKGCPRCTVAMETGCLNVMPQVIFTNPMPCSLILLWTSYESNLYDFDCRYTLNTSKQIKYLPIDIDFIPSRKISRQQIDRSKPLFMVPKKCSFCYCRCRLSDCLGEIEHFLNNVSETHRQSYLIIKFIFQFFGRPPKYHLKVILFQHCKICTDSSEDCATCVLSILRELVQSYENGVLMSFRGNVNLLEGPHEEDWYNERRTLNRIIKQLSNFKTWTLMRRYGLTY